jgi:hypothetical protein
LKKKTYCLQFVTLFLLLLSLDVDVLLVSVLHVYNGYFELIFGLLGEEIAQYMKISSMLLEQDVEELDFLRSPYLRLLFAPVLLVPA